MPAVVSAPTAAQSANPAPQNFSDSLQAASRAYPENGVAGNGNLKATPMQRQGSKDASSSAPVSNGRTVQSPNPGAQTVKLAQGSTRTTSQAQVNATPAESQASEAADFTNAATRVANALDTGTSASGSQGIKSNGTLPLVIHQDGSEVGQIALKSSAVVASAVLPLSKGQGSKAASSSKTEGSAANAAKSASDQTVPQATVSASNAALIPVQLPAPEQNTLPIGAADTSSDGLTSTTELSAPNAAVNEMPATFTKAILNAPLTGMQTASSLIAPSAKSSAALGTQLNAMPSPVSGSESDAASNELPDAVRNAMASQPQGKAASVQASASIAGLNAASNVPLNRDVVQAPQTGHTESSQRGSAPASSSLPGDRSTSQPAASGQDLPTNGGLPATGVNDLGGAAGQLAALIPLPGAGALELQAGASILSKALASKSSISVASGPVAMNGKDGLKDASSGGVDSNQHVQPGTLQSGSQTGSQDTASSGNPGQGGNASQAQSAATVQMNLGSQAAVANTHTAAVSIGMQAQPAATSAGTTVASSKAAESTVSASVPAPQPLPAIHTATLIQNMNQSEMRVGMRSNEFGNISISTSATRDLISTQISLDHSELAKTLTAHLPEMQAKLGASQAMDVRIDLNGERGGQGAGPSGGGQNGSTDQWRGARQQAASAATSQSNIGMAVGQFSTAASAAANGDGRLNARLDIRV